MHLAANNRKSSQELETVCLEATMEEKYWGVNGYSKITRSF